MVTSQYRIPVQIDGDPGGYLPAHSRRRSVGRWTVEVIPAAVDVIAPVKRRPVRPEVRSPATVVTTIKSNGLRG